MAGVKGRSGGPRPNSGGSRPGAGRKPKQKEPAPPPAVVATRDPLEFLLDVMQGIVVPTKEQLSAARAAAQYKHAKKGDAGKKEGSVAAAKVAAAGKFAAAQPPKLVASNGRKV